MNFGRMETAPGPGAECEHVTVFWPMKSCRHMSPSDHSENNKKSYFHCTVIIITSFYKTIEEVETAIKQYSKEHYFIRLNRPRGIKKIYSSGIAPNE